MERNQTHAKVLKMVVMGLLVAVSIVLVTLIHIPFRPPCFWSTTPLMFPIFIGTFLLGQCPAKLTVLASLIQGLTVSAGSGPIGILMHVLATGSFALVAGTIDKRAKTRRNALIAPGAGVVVQVAVMILCNLVFHPLFMGTAMKDVEPMLLPIILPLQPDEERHQRGGDLYRYKPVSRVAHRILGQPEPAAEKKRRQELTNFWCRL